MIETLHDTEFDQASSLRKMVEDKIPKYLESDLEENDFHDTRKGTRIITITSGKGGVGKSSIAVNLGLSLVNSGKKVLLFDGDLGLANINVLMGIIPKYNLYHTVKGYKSISEIIIHTPEGLDIIPGASGHSNIANLSEKERKSIIQDFTRLNRYDVFLIDTGAGINLNVVELALPADDIIVLTTPEPTSITDAYGIIKSIALVSSDKNIHLVVNRASSSIEGRKVSERLVNICEQFLNFKIQSLGFIYEDINVSKSVRKQKPFYLLFPKSKASACLNILTSKILDQDINLRNKSNGIGKFFKKLLQV